jgi:hypothetical protein
MNTTFRRPYALLFVLGSTLHMACDRCSSVETQDASEASGNDSSSNRTGLRRSDRLPSERRGWPVVSCESVRSMALGASAEICIRGAAEWTDMGAVMCDGHINVDTPGLPNIFAVELLEHCQHHLDATCDNCRVTGLQEVGRGELDACMRLTAPQPRNRQDQLQITGKLAGSDDVAVTYIQSQVYFYVSPKSTQLKQASLVNARLRARWTDSE